MRFTFLTFSSLCFKQSVKTTFLTPDFSSILRVLCSVNAISLSDFYPIYDIPRKKAARHLTCLLDRSARSNLLRTSRCGLTSKVSWNTGFLPDRGICVTLRKKTKIAAQVEGKSPIHDAISKSHCDITISVQDILKFFFFPNSLVGLPINVLIQSFVQDVHWRCYCIVWKSYHSVWFKQH